MNEGETQDVPLEMIDIFAHQSREVFDEAELDQLTENIKLHGQLQPGLAWHDAARDRLILICGERRLRALQRAGKKTMALKVIRGTLTQGQMLQMNVSENLQRADINPIERGQAFRRMMQLEGITAREVSARLQVSEATVSRDLSLLDLPPVLQAKVASGELPSSVGSSLARLDDDETRNYLAEQFAKGELSRDGVADEVKKRRGGSQSNGNKPQRLMFKLGAATVTVTAKQPLTWKDLGDVIDRLRRETKPLVESSGSEVARALKASKPRSSHERAVSSAGIAQDGG